MSYAGLLNNQCSVYRRTYPGGDVRADPVNALVAADVPCRITGDKSATLNSKEILTPHDTEIRNLKFFAPYWNKWDMEPAYLGKKLAVKDFINVDGEIYEVTEIYPDAGGKRNHHLEAMIKAVRASDAGL